MKKTICILLAIIICLSLLIPAFADDEIILPEISSDDSDNTSTVIINQNDNNTSGSSSSNNDTDITTGNDSTRTDIKKTNHETASDNASNHNTTGNDDEIILPEISSDDSDNTRKIENNQSNNQASKTSSGNKGNNSNTDNKNDTSYDSANNDSTNDDSFVIDWSNGQITLPEMPSEDPFFSDIVPGIWYASDVAKATELGLINGYDGKFYPDNNLTYSEAIKLAACMHQLKTTGKVTLVNGTKNWYDTYVEYAKQNKIISKDYEWTVNATRAGYVEIFAHALPDDALKVKNTVADGAIPDVAMSDYAASEIYKLYRAGILNGSDAKGTFNPNSNILRCEVAAILTRMMDESARKTISLT